MFFRQKSLLIGPRAAGVRCSALPSKLTILGRGALKRNIFALPSSWQPNFSKVHHEIRILPFSPEQVFDVVADVKNYRNFLPFCVGSRITRARSKNSFEAELAVGFKLFTERYTSLVELNRPYSIVSRALNSPTFKKINGKWEFSHGPDEFSTKVSFQVEFEVESQIAAAAVNTFFTEITNQQVRAFDKRCHQVYGRPKRKQQIAVASLEVDVCDPEGLQSDDDEGGVGGAAAAAAAGPGSGARRRKLARARAEIKEAGQVFARHCEMHRGAAAAAAAAAAGGGASPPPPPSPAAAAASGGPAAVSLPAFRAACRELALRFPGFYQLSADPALVAALYGSLRRWLYENREPTPHSFMARVYHIVEACPEARAHMLFEAMDRNADGRVTPEGMARAFSGYLTAISHVIPELVCETVTADGGNDGDACATESWALVKEIMEEVRADIPSAVAQVFRDVGADPDASSGGAAAAKGITIEDWEKAWRLHPDLLDIASMRSMSRLVHWVAVLRAAPIRGVAPEAAATAGAAAAAAAGSSSSAAASSWGGGVDGKSDGRRSRPLGGS